MTGDSWPYFEAYLGTERRPQALNVWGWGSHEEAKAAMCEFLGEPVSEAADQLATMTRLCVDYDGEGVDKGERSTVLTIRKALSVSGGAHPILSEVTTRIRGGGQD